MTSPLFSVVIPTHNRWPFVAEAVQSVLDQEFDDVEVLVVDDGSTDGTADLLRKQFPSVHVIEQENAERGAARNRGIAESSGRFLMFLDSDDRYEPGHCAVVAAAIEAAPHAAVLVTRAVLWAPPSGATWPLHIHPEAAELSVRAGLWGNPVPIQGLIVRRDVITHVGGFPEDRAVAGSEDWIFALRVLAAQSAVQLKQDTVRIRQHPGRSMADSVGITRSREAATALLLRDGLLGQPLDPQQRARLQAGTAYFKAAHEYEAGRMRSARSCLSDVQRHVGKGEGLRLTWRLSVLSRLGPRGSLILRRARDFVAGRV